MQNVYLIRCQTYALWDYFKIGIATDAESRLAQLQTGNPHLLSIVSCFEFENAQAVETVLHQKYRNERIRGEWFRLAENQVVEFDSVCEILGGVRQIPTEETAALSDVEEAEEIAETIPNGKWDYAAMFSDGWRMEPADSRGVKGKYWSWRKRGKTREYLYGGTVASLPGGTIEFTRNLYELSQKG